jgi:hypothetical protein
VFFSARKSPRLPLVVEVRVDCHDRSLTASSVEVGAGGMALRNANTLTVSQPIQVSFALPEAASVTIQAVVWWKKGELLGLRFDPSDDNRLRVQRWFDARVPKPQAKP